MRRELLSRFLLFPLQTSDLRLEHPRLMLGLLHLLAHGALLLDGRSSRLKILFRASLLQVLPHLFLFISNPLRFGFYLLELCFELLDSFLHAEAIAVSLIS